MQVITNFFSFVFNKRCCLSKYVNNNYYDHPRDPTKPSIFLKNLFIDAMDEVLEDESWNSQFDKLKEEPIGTF